MPYAEAMPSFDRGGTVARTGVAMVHAGETFTPPGASQAAIDYAALSEAMVGAFARSGLRVQVGSQELGQLMTDAHRGNWGGFGTEVG